MCKCDCGNFVEIVGIDLRNGHTKSCGCIHSEQLVNRNKEMAKENAWDTTSKEYGIGYTSKGEEFYFDKEDFEDRSGQNGFNHRISPKAS